MVRRVKLRLALPVAALALLVAAPSAGAASQGGVAAAIAGELAKQGLKAGIAHFAPDLAKTLDPTSAHLEAIREQLAQLDAKITELKVHQQHLEARLNCSVQRSGVDSILARAQTNLELLASAQKLSSQSSRQARLNALYNDYGAISSDQLDLHQRLIGSGGVIRACAEHIEQGMRPFLTSKLAPAVHDFYATYEAAAVSMLVVRLNILAYKPDDFEDIDPTALATKVNGWITEEQSFIKPAFPNTESYDFNTNLLFKTHVYHEAALFGKGERPAVDALLQQGWWATGRTYVPTCRIFEIMIRSTGHTGTLGVQELVNRGVFVSPGREMACYDDHDNHYTFDIQTFTYIRKLSFTDGTVICRHGPWNVDVSKYAYKLP
jgi:hypothetical protein